MEKTALQGIFAKGDIPPGANYRTALTDILHTFPYFQVAQILLAKQLYDSHEPEAPGRIKLASVYAPDRKVMYHLFKTTDSTPIADAPQKTLSKPENKEVKYNFVYTSSATTKNAEITHSQQKVETEPSTLPNQESTHTETFIRKETESKLPVIPPVEKTIRADSSKTVSPPPEPKKVDTPLPIPVTEKKEEKSPVKRVGLENIRSIEENALPEEKRKVEITPVSLTSNEPITDNNLKYSFSSWLKVIPEISIPSQEPEKPVAQQKTSDIIDSFLTKLPSISRPKTEFFSPAKAAKMSVTEDDTIVSETLAKIYFEQGNLQKALNAYKTLLTEFPEKKNIFAPRIEKIKALMRENTKPATK